MKGVKFGKRGTKKNGYKPTFTIGVQSFTLDIGGPETDTVRIGWYHRQLKYAFQALMEANGIKPQPKTKRKSDKLCKSKSMTRECTK